MTASCGIIELMQRRDRMRLMRKHYADISCDGYYRQSYLRNTLLTETINYESENNEPADLAFSTIDRRAMKRIAPRDAAKYEKNAENASVPQNIAHFVLSTLPRRQIIHMHMNNI